MATYHFTAKAGSKGKGASASIHAEYILREGKYSSRPDLENSGSGNLPHWAKDNPVEFWRAADIFERKNGVVYREHELALPIEATPEQRKEMIEAWCAEHYENHAFLYAIHGKSGNPHAHIMISDRESDGIDRDLEQYFKREASSYRDRKTKELKKSDPAKGGCRKSPKWNGPNRAKHLDEMRKAWAETQNEFYQTIGLDVRVDNRTLEAQRKEALDEIEIWRFVGNGPKVMAEIRRYKDKAVSLDRDPDRRINHRRYRILQRNGQLSELNDLRTASRSLAAAKGDLQDTVERRNTLYKEQRKISDARASACEAEQNRRARYRANSRTIKTSARFAANVLPTPLSEVIQIAAEALVIITKINDWKQAHKYRRQVDQLKAESAKVREKIAAGQSAGQQSPLKDNEPLVQQTAVEVYRPDTTAAALRKFAGHVTDPDVQHKCYKLAMHVEKLSSEVIIYQGPCKLQPPDLYSFAVRAVNNERQRKHLAQGIDLTDASNNQPSARSTTFITGTASTIAEHYRSYAREITSSEPEKARTLVAICNSELGNIPISRELTLPHPSSDLKEIREALKQQQGVRGRKR